MRYNNKSIDNLWVIALEDENGNWWNIYIDTDVTDIVWTLYADKAIISYSMSYDNWDSNPIISHEIDWAIWSDILKNQLYVYGTMFTENTIGGSLIPQCPYYIVSWSCDMNEARKYDLNFLRRYFLQSGGTPYPSSDPWVKSSYSPTDVNPMVIEYNPNIQITPPPLFSNED
jgi:hypothetical protein